MNNVEPMSNIRIITTKEGYTEVKKSMEAAIYKNGTYRLLYKLESQKEFKDIVYLSWKELKQSDISILKSVLDKLEAKDITYRIAIIRSNFDINIEENHYTSAKDQEKKIPFPSFIQIFDENDIERRLNNYLNKQNEMECVEYSE